MLDLRKIRNNPEEIKKALQNRGEDFKDSVIDEVIALDEQRRSILVEVEVLKNKRNKVSSEIPKLKKAGEDVTSIMAEMRELGDKIKEEDLKVAEINEKIEYIMLRMPNIPNPLVPEGATDEDNIEIKKWALQEHGLKDRKTLEHLKRILLTFKAILLKTHTNISFPFN